MIADRADISSTAVLAEDVSVGAFSRIGPGVSIGSGTVIASHVSIEAGVQIGSNNYIASFVALGGRPQHSGDVGASGRLLVGDGNQIHEHCVIHRGTDDSSDQTTRIGNGCVVMNGTHIGHDVHVEDAVHLLPFAAVAGHVHLGHHAVIGAYCGVHQHTRIGPLAFLARGCFITQDALPFVRVAHNPARLMGLNLVGLRRCGYDALAIKDLKRAYDCVVRLGLRGDDLLSALADCGSSQAVLTFVSAIRMCQRGFLGIASTARDADALA